jgi:hypothetical protein
MALRGRRFNDVNMIKARLQLMFAQFKTMNFTICLECWCDGWASCTKPQGDNVDEKVSVR